LLPPSSCKYLDPSYCDETLSSYQVCNSMEGDFHCSGYAELIPMGWGVNSDGTCYPVFGHSMGKY
jgi:hypothetical protein